MTAKILLMLFSVVLCSSVWAISFPTDLFEGKTADPIGKAEIMKELTPGRTTRINRCVLNAHHTPIVLGGRTYLRGIGVHADSHVRFTFNEPIVRFISTAGIDSAAFGKPAMDFCTVIADGSEVFRSEVLKADNTVLNLDLPLNNITALELKAERPDKQFNSDWFSWGDARVITKSGKIVYLDTILSKARLTQGLPFSFTYGGRSSRELLAELPLQTDRQGSITTYTWVNTDGLEIKASVTQYEEGAEWTVRFTNKGADNSAIISDLAALDLQIEDTADSPIIPLTVPGDKGRRLDLSATENNIAVMTMEGSRGFKGFNANEFRQTAALLQTGKPISIRHKDLIPTSDDAAPYFSVKWPEGGIVFGLGWTGPWKADISRQDNNIHITAGRDNVHTYLKPGESLRSARVLTAWYEGPDMQTGLNAWRRTMINHIIPHSAAGEPEYIPLLFYPSWRETTSASEKSDLSYLKYLKGTDFEAVWFDAWPHRNSFPKGMGNYHYPIDDTIDPVRYPHGMKAVTNPIKALDKQVLMWFAPETIMADTFMAKEHPEWMMSVNGGKSGYFALVNPEARTWMVEFLSQCFRKWHIDYFRTDSFTELANLLAYTGETADDRRGIAENMFCEALYDFWDRLLENNPGLIIDNCAGGGTRLDLELMSRSFAMWRSDSAVGIHDAARLDILNQHFTSNLNIYIPWSIGVGSGSTPYDFRSCFNTGMHFKPQTPLSQEDKAVINKGLAECQRLRKYCLGDFYSISNPGSSLSEWCIWQYHRQVENDGCLLAFRRPESEVYGREAGLRAVDDNTSYKVDIYETYDLRESRVMTGAELKHIDLEIREAPGSLLIEYSAVR